MSRPSTLALSHTRANTETPAPPICIAVDRGDICGAARRRIERRNSWIRESAAAGSPPAPQACHASASPASP
ncbi:unnamed protein product [Boreogadus saida]